MSHGATVAKYMGSASKTGLANVANVPDESRLAISLTFAVEGLSGVKFFKFGRGHLKVFTTKCLTEIGKDDTNATVFSFQPISHGSHHGTC